MPSTLRLVSEVITCKQKHICTQHHIYVQELTHNKSIIEGPSLESEAAEFQEKNQIFVSQGWFQNQVLWHNFPSDTEMKIKVWTFW